MLKEGIKGTQEVVVSEENTAGAEPKEYDEVEICLDRPFYYIICKEGVPFLIGFVHNPVE